MIYRTIRNISRDIYGAISCTVRYIAGYEIRYVHHLCVKTKLIVDSRRFGQVWRRQYIPKQYPISCDITPKDISDIVSISHVFHSRYRISHPVDISFSIPITIIFFLPTGCFRWARRLTLVLAVGPRQCRSVRRMSTPLQARRRGATRAVPLRSG